MQPNQTPQNLALALALSNMNQGGEDASSFGNAQVNPQQLRGMPPPQPASYSYQPQQSQMSQMQLSPTQQSMYMPQQQQQASPWGDAMKGVAQSLGKINQQNQSQPYNPYDQWQPDYGNMMDYSGAGLFGI